jgi:hypothetical protein
MESDARHLLRRRSIAGRMLSERRTCVVAEK